MSVAFLEGELSNNTRRATRPRLPRFAFLPCHRLLKMHLLSSESAVSLAFQSVQDMSAFVSQTR
jgi:hypothetical protein